MSIQKMVKLFFLLAIAIVKTAAQSERNILNVEFEYQLEVQDSTKSGSTRDVLAILDGSIIGRFQNIISDVNADGEHLIKFDNIKSNIFSECFTESDECSLVRSNMEISYEDERPEISIEMVTLQMVQDLLHELTNSNNNEIIAFYMYPLTVSTLAKFQFTPTLAPMTDIEVSILERTFMEVFGAIVFALEGDTLVRTAQYMYQDIINDDNGADASTSLTADLLISGSCRDCTDEEFEMLMSDIIPSNISAFLRRLQINSDSLNSTYFNDVSDIIFSVPELPLPLKPTQNSSIYDKEASSINNNQPWFLWFGLCVAVLIVFAGCYILVQDSIVYEKDAYSTGDSSQDIGVHGDVEGYRMKEEGFDDVELTEN